MKIQLARKLHRLPQPSTPPIHGQFAFWMSRQHAAFELTAVGLGGSPSHAQTVSSDAAAG